MKIKTFIILICLGLISINANAGDDWGEWDGKFMVKVPEWAEGVGGFWCHKYVDEFEETVTVTAENPFWLENYYDLETKTWGLLLSTASNQNAILSGCKASNLKRKNKIVIDY